MSLIRKYQLPVFLFLILEKSKIISFTSQVNIPNHYYIVMDKNWIYILNQIIRKEYFLSSSFLVENSAIDINYLNSSKLINIQPTNLIGNTIIYYTYYILLLKLRLTTMFVTTNTNTIISIDKIFKNANWAERETSEMYDINYIWKNDTRKILIDYSKNEYPLLKDYPSEGFQDVFYNFFESQVFASASEVVEL